MFFIRMRNENPLTNSANVIEFIKFKLINNGFLKQLTVKSNGKESKRGLQPLFSHYQVNND